MEFERDIEESKIHNPFLAENFLKRELFDKGMLTEITGQPVPGKKGQEAPTSKPKRYFGDQQIEQMLKMKRGIVNRITGSFLIAFDDPSKEDRQVVDIGLNIKNFTKKVHVPDFVRFIADRDGAANTIYDDFQHNQHSRGAKHVRKHWEYSEECLQIIQDYQNQFPEAIDAIDKCSRSNKSMHSLYDLFPDMQKSEKLEAIKRLKQMLEWIENLPISKLAYVEMGFDALDTSLVKKLEAHNKHIKENYATIDLKVQKNEILQISNIY